MTAEGPELDTVSVLDHIRALLREMDLRYQQRFDAQSRALEAALLAAEKAVGTALTAAEKAVNKAETAAEKRFEAVNEFRQQLNDYQATLMPRNEYDSAHQSLVEKISDLSSRVDKTEGSSKGGQQMWGYVAAAIGLVVAIAALLFK
jgi:SMC interacting uncharacterized protein involved in chromosome segregation